MTNTAMVVCHVMLAPALLASLLVCFVAAEENPEGVTELLKTLLLNYDARLAPGFTPQADLQTEIYVGMDILDVHSIDDSQMQFAMDFVITRQWFDKRLVFTNSTATDLTQVALRGDYLTQIWRPDIYFVNEREGQFHVVTRPNDVAIIHRDGTVFYISKITDLLASPMHLQAYPLDTQFAQTELITYSYDLQYARLVWRPDKPTAVAPDSSIKLDEFQIIETVAMQCGNIYSTSERGYPCLKAYLKLERRYEAYVITIFVPTAGVVTMSWSAFWINAESVPGRVTVSATAVLTIFTQTFFISLRLPKVPYVKAADVWMAGCMVFVFASMAEYAIVNLILRSHTKYLERKRDNLAELNAKAGKSAVNADVLAQIAQFLNEMGPENERSYADMLDIISRFLFPFSFLVYVIMFAVYYTQFIEDRNVDDLS